MFLQITMSYTSLNYVDRQNSHQKVLKLLNKNKKPTIIMNLIKQATQYLKLS